MGTRGERSLRVFDDLGTLLAAAREEVVVRAQKALRAWLSTGAVSVTRQTPSFST